MNFSEKEIYHIYNRGNNSQPIFFERENYLHFLRLVQKYIYANCQILAWCLMPNHFHFLIYADAKSIEYLQNRNIPIQQLSESIRLLLSSYTKAINHRYTRKGNLFQQGTKSKNVYDGKNNYAEQAFNYIHLNPVKAKLSVKMSGWEFSSYRDFALLRKGKLRNQKIVSELLGINLTEFEKYSEGFKDDPDEKKIL